MLEYKFKYNVPPENDKWNCRDLMINCTAFLLSDNDIHIEVDSIGAGTLVSVKNWEEAMTQAKQLARIEFDQMTAVKEVEKLVA